MVNSKKLENLRGFQIVLVDETVTVGVDHLEGLLELLELGLLEHGEDIGALGDGLLLSLITATHFVSLSWTVVWLIRGYTIYVFEYSISF